MMKSISRARAIFMAVEFRCEICGNYTYWGRRAFERHFTEWRHAHGMKCLRIPNSKHFHDITRIEDAVGGQKRTCFESCVGDLKIRRLLCMRSWGESKRFKDLIPILILNAKITWAMLWTRERKSLFGPNPYLAWSTSGYQVPRYAQAGSHLKTIILTWLYFPIGEVFMSCWVHNFMAREKFIHGEKDYYTSHHNEALTWIDIPFLWVSL